MTDQQRSAALEAYCKTRSVELRNELVQEFLYLAQIVAKKYAGKGVEYDDLYQIASMALIGALERYDCSKGIKFASFAAPTLMGVVKNYFRDSAKVLRMPRRLGENVRRLALAREALLQQNQRQPTVVELAERMRVSQADVLEAMEASAAAQVGSLDEKLKPGEDAELSDFLGKEEDAYERIALRDMLKKVMETLSPTERQILEQRYAAHKSQRQIAEEMGVSQMYVSRLERKLLERFRMAM